jgi:mono/diheme cytochrome c family protein
MRLSALCAVCFAAWPAIALADSASAFGASDALTLTSPTHSRLVSLEELEEKLKPVIVTVYDPLYGKEKTYDGFPLQDVLKLTGPLSSSVDEVVFHALDGYAPRISLRAIEGHPAFVVFREHGAAHRWERQRLPSRKTWVTPAPYYLVWAEGKALGNAYPRPYQLTRIELVSSADRYPNLYPPGAATNSAVFRGFTLFKGHCISCHSINLEGGTVGPELNVPQNITEYWSRDVLRRFILDVSAFRLKSKMPVFAQILTTAQVDDVLSYLAAMKDHKHIPRPKPN